MEEKITKVHGFQAAHDFLNAYFQERETVGLRTVLSGMLLDERGRSVDPGTMYTWVEALATVRGVDVRDYDDEDRPSHPSASVGEWFQALEIFLRYYANIWKDDQFHRLISELDAANPTRSAGAEYEAWQTWRALCERTGDPNGTISEGT